MGKYFPPKNKFKTKSVGEQIGEGARGSLKPRVPGEHGLRSLPAPRSALGRRRTGGHPVQKPLRCQRVAKSIGWQSPVPHTDLAHPGGQVQAAPAPIHETEFPRRLAFPNPQFGKEEEEEWRKRSVDRARALVIMRTVCGHLLAGAPRKGDMHAARSSLAARRAPSERAFIFLRP
jgi:hypothetical protein